MSSIDASFDQRLRRLMRKHRRMSGGVVHRIGKDGLITAYPRRRVAAFPLRAVVLLIGAVFLFKAFLLINLGPATYAERVALLQSGSLFEQAGAWLMQADPATVAIADGLRALMN